MDSSTLPRRLLNEGVSSATQLLVNEFDKWPGSWSSNGKELIYSQAHPQRGNDLWVWSEATPDKPRLFLGTAAEELLAEFAPDGRAVAYVSDESGRKEVYVVSYPEPHTKRKISTDGGSSPHWSADGTRIFFQSADWVMVARFSQERGGTASRPERFVQGVDIEATWDVAPDGSYVVAVEKRPPPQLRLVLNWFEDLKRRVPSEGN